MSRVKIVPDAEPNADGRWIDLPDHAPPANFVRQWDLLKPYLPAGHHVVQVESDTPPDLPAKSDE